MSAEAKPAAAPALTLHRAFVRESRYCMAQQLRAGRPRNWVPWMCAMVVGAVWPLLPWPDAFPQVVALAGAIMIVSIGLFSVAAAALDIWRWQRRGERLSEARALLTVSHMFAPVTPNLTVMAQPRLAGRWSGAVITCRSGAKWHVDCVTKDPVELVEQAVLAGRRHWEKCEGCRDLAG